MTTLTGWVLDHKRLVLGFWLATTIAAFAAIGPAGSALSQQFNVGGAPVEVTGLDALRASASENEGDGTGALLGTLLAALGALLVLAFVFRSFTAIVPLLMARSRSRPLFC